MANIIISNDQLPRLTSVTKDAERMGRAAVDLLVKRIADPGRPYATVEFKARVVYRESTFTYVPEVNGLEDSNHG